MRMVLSILFAFVPAPLISQSTDQPFDGGQTYCTYAFIGPLASFAQRCRPEDAEIIELLTRFNKIVEPRLLDSQLITAEEIAKSETDAFAADCTSSDYRLIYDQLAPQIETMKQGLKSIEHDTRTPIRTECVP